MDRFKLTEVNAILVFLVMNFIMLGIVASVMNFNFQVASQQRQENIDLTKAVHDLDQTSNTRINIILNQTIYKIQQISDLQKNATKKMIELLFQNQDIIRNTTSTNLNNTFLNRDNIKLILDKEREILNSHVEIMKAIKLLNSTSTLKR